MARFSDGTSRGARGQPQAGHGPGGRARADPVGTAPGLWYPARPTVVVLPGPPRELQPMWPPPWSPPGTGGASPAAHEVPRSPCGSSGCPSRGWPRPYARRERIPGFELLEITTCLGAGRSSRHPLRACATGVYAQLLEVLRESHGHEVFRKMARAWTTRSRSCWPAVG